MTEQVSPREKDPLGFWNDVKDELFNVARTTKKVGQWVATAGGHQELERARYSYESCRCKQEASKTLYEQAARFFRDSTEKVNLEAKKSMDMLAEAKDIVERLSWDATSSNLPHLTNIQIPSMQGVDRVLSQVQMVVESGKGVGIGAAAGVGAWLIVAHLGTASTGAAISGLAGAASTSAIFAWFGGGALAAGGGGMALGGVVLGAVSIIPAIAYLAFRSYKEAARIEAKEQELVAATTSNNENSQKIRDLVKMVDSLGVWVRERNSIFSDHLLAFRARSLGIADEIAVISNAFADELSAQTRNASIG